MALGSRLRMLSEKITENAEQLYAIYQVELKPKWFPVFYVISENQAKSITEIAEEIGHSHPSVVKIVKEMSFANIVKETKDINDKRKNLISLTTKGKSINDKIKKQYYDVNNAVEQTLNQTRHNIWYAMEELEFLLDQQSLLSRVVEQKKLREAQEISIVPFEPKYQSYFKDLNQAWITQYFKMEDSDYKSLMHPKEYILDKGGEILVALHNNIPVGVCALIKMDDPEFDYELAKMAVDPSTQGKGVGCILGMEIIKKATQLGAKNLYLESNTILKPAINLYHKLGFKKVVGIKSPYERCNIQMELSL